MLILLGLLAGLVIVGLAPFLVLTPRAPRPPAQLTNIAELETYLKTLTENETPPALQITVLKKGALVYSKAFGIADGPARRPALTTGVYHFWSVTKLFTATAVMQLADDGKLSLADPVSMYVPSFATTSPTGEPVEITIRELLNHTAGMKNITPSDLVGWIHHLGDPPVSQVELVEKRMGSYRKLASVPASVSSYSNAGYLVLGAVIQKVSGQSYEGFVRERLLQPIGMDHTDFVYRNDMLPQAVAGSHPLFHFFTPLLLVIHRDWFSSWVYKTEKYRMWLSPLYTDYTGPTGLIGTAEDLARFGQVFLDRGRGVNGEVLRPETVTRMLDDDYGGHTGPDNDRMGLGWHWWDDAALPFKGHGGDGPGFSAQLAIFPDRQMVIVVLANDTLTDRVGLTKLVADVFK
jgi:CubicO group peptidase (beta-lactamase class C family)